MPKTERFLISIGPLTESVNLIVFPSSFMVALIPVLLKLICFTNSDGSSPVISVVIVAVPKLPVKSKVHVPGFLFSKVNSATPVDLTASTPPVAVLIE